VYVDSGIYRKVWALKVRG